MATVAPPISMLRYSPSYSETATVAMWGATIPYLPDLGPTTLSTTESPVHAIYRAWLTFVSAIAQLPVDKNITYDLRLRLSPNNRELNKIEIALLGTATRHCNAVQPIQGNEAQAVRQDALFAWSALSGLLPPAYPLQSIREADLEEWRTPYGFTPHIVEVRKRVIHLGNHPLKKVAYRFNPSVVGPAQVCRALLERNQPCMISVAVSPAQLTETERRELFGALNATVNEMPSTTEIAAASRAQHLKHEQDKLLNLYPGARPEVSSPVMLRPDPQVAPIAAILSQMLTASALLFVRIAVVAPEVDVAQELAFAFGAELVQPYEAEDARSLSGFEVIISSDKNDITRLQNCVRFAITKYDVDRLTVLCAPSEAAAAFRLPAVTGSWIGIPTRPLSPFRPANAFWRSQPETSGPENGPRIRLGQIIDDSARYQGLPAYTLLTDDLTQHALIVGGTGSGKTGTGLQIIDQIRRLPGSERPRVLLIDPVKTELRPLIRQQEAGRLLFFSAGSAFSPLYLDVFRIPDGVSPEQHLQILTGCFSAAFPMGGPLELLLTRSFRDVYSELYAGICGNDLTRPVLCGDRRPETPPDILEQVAVKARERIKKYSGDIRGNLTAAVEHRLEWLAEGAVGRLLAPHRGDLVLDIDTIMSNDILIELRLLPGNEEKALVMALLLAILGEHYSYSLAARGKSADTGGRLRHLTWIDEAQRLLAGSASTAQDPEVANARGRAIELFVEMLSEMRSRGEGLLISTQLPSLLDPRVRKHPGLKIMHRLTPEDDRQVLGTAMNLDAEQLKFVTQLEAGVAVVFRGQMPAAMLVQVDDLRHNWAARLANGPTVTAESWTRATSVSEQEVAQIMENEVFGVTKG